MYTIKDTYTASFSMLSSSFTGYLFPCTSEADFNGQLEHLKNKYADATHHCRAWRILDHDLTEFQSDDGEPAGTAGFPILNQLRSSDLVNVGIIVIRYYGGTKLGRSGLAEAYATAAEECIAKAESIELKLVQLVCLHYDYPHENLVRGWIRTFSLVIVESDYTERIKLLLGVNIDSVSSLTTVADNAEHLGITYHILGRQLIHQ